MTSRRVGHALLFLVVCAGLLVPAARADSDVRIVRLSYVSGDVQMDRGTGQGFEAAVMNMPVTRGSRIFTGDDGYAEVEFEDGSTARLTPGTELNMLELSLHGDGGRVSMIEVQQGTAYFDLRATDADDFRVTVAGHDLQVPRHARFRISGEQDTVRVAVFDGTLVVPTGDGRVEVGKNQTLSLDLSDPSRYQVVRSVSEEAYDQWDHDRADYRANYQAAPSSGSGSYDGGYDTGYSYGVSDMNYYGSYTYISGWGNVWQPYFVGAGWNPWMDGAWVWYPGIGYVWVSAYPWGWMPYRYGGWYFISGHGWCWRPDRHWQHWSPVAPVYNAPPNFRPPVVPVSGGPVVPVGRGPVTLYPNPDDRDWRGPRRPVDPGAPGGKVRLSEKVPQHPVTPVPMRPRIPDEGVPAPVVGPAQPVTPSPAPVTGGAGSFKGGEPVRPAPIPVRVLPDEHVALPATGAPAQPAGPAPAPAGGAGTYKPQPVHPVTPIPMRSGDEGTSTPPPASPTPPAAPPHSRWQSEDGGSSRGSGGSTHVSTPPPAAPAPPPVYSGPAQSGGGGGGSHATGGSGGGYHPSPPPSPPSSPRSSGSSGGGYSGGGGGGSSSGASHSSSGGGSSSGASHSSSGGASSSGGSHSSGGSSTGSHSNSSSSGSKSPK